MLENHGAPFYTFTQGRHVLSLIWVNIGSANANEPLPDSIKQLQEQMPTHH